MVFPTPGGEESNALHASTGPALHAEGGAGPPILLLHGLMGAARTWARQLPWLREWGRVYTLDALGHGRPAVAPLNTAAFVADVAAQTVAIAEPMVVIGHSMGGLHGWVFAARYPHRVAALVVEDMAPDFRGRSAEHWAAMIAAWPRFVDAAAVRAYFGPVAGDYFLQSLQQGPDGYRLHGEVATFRTIAEEWGRRDFWDAWRQVQAPSLLIEAQRSATGPGQMREMAHCHRNATHVMIRDCGHIVHDEQPAAYRSAVEAFLSVRQS